ncbi:hypothetical protein [Yinghuangia sp. YIM S10712]|uniref:hypothetical protein n=1 Tax=Yinghuangia sp. YIM S10712 TaxID=3436930 RepID=UPI003F534E78
MSSVLLSIEPHAVTPADIEIVDLDGAEISDDTFDIEVIADLEGLSEDNRCSCAASDDNPY